MFLARMMHIILLNLVLKMYGVSGEFALFIHIWNLPLGRRNRKCVHLNQM